MPIIDNRIIPIELIKPHPRNYKIHPDAQLDDLRASQQEFGQFRSVVLWAQDDGTYIQVAGHGYTQGLRQDGIQEVRADILPSSTSSTTIERILIADNRLPMGATDNTILLTQMLQEQLDAGFSLAALGSSSLDLQKMLEQVVQEELPIGEEEKKGALLALLDVTIADPRHEVKLGDIWKLSRKHTLICAHVMKDWSIWIRYLSGERVLFLPFPGPFSVLGPVTDMHTLVLVQPDTYIAGHILDRYAEIHGDESVWQAARVAAHAIEEEQEVDD